MVIDVRGVLCRLQPQCHHDKRVIPFEYGYTYHGATPSAVNRTFWSSAASRV